MILPYRLYFSICSTELKGKKMGKANEEYVAKAKKLSEKQQERLLSRMDTKLHKRMDKHKLTPLEAIAIQLEVEDELLEEWRDKVAEIREKESKAKQKLEKKKQKADTAKAP
jgi:hypothetical protein